MPYPSLFMQLAAALAEPSSLNTSAIALLASVAALIWLKFARFEVYLYWTTAIPILVHKADDSRSSSGTSRFSDFSGDVASEPLAFNHHGRGPDGSQISHHAALHYAETLQILQARLKSFEQGQEDVMYCDSTIVAIIMLAAAEELTGNLTAVEHHIEGMLKIVSLSGGVRSLNTHNNIQVKVCRADLGLALCLGSRPRLFGDTISQDCFIADRGVIRCTHESHDAQIRVFVDALDSKLANCGKDLHSFSCMTNMAYQTTGKLSPNTYNEMMTSVLYRLMHLSFEQRSTKEAVRIALLTFSSTIFLTRHYMKTRYKELFHLFSNALFQPHQSTNITLPHPIMLSLIFLHHITAYKQSSPKDWQRVRFNKALVLSGASTWSQIREILKSDM